MEQARRFIGAPANGVVVTFDVAADDPGCLAAIATALAGTDLAQLFVFASPRADFPGVMAAISEMVSCPVVGCTTAGEIGVTGYVEDHIVVVGLPRQHFATRTVLIEDLAQAELTSQVDRLIQTRLSLTAAHPDKSHGFSFLVIDGLSRQEDALVNALAPSLAGFPLFGGSAGDGLRFQESFIAVEGRILQDAAALTFVATSCPTQVFSLNHMRPTQTRMVVTDADPSQRIVKGINAERAAAEYARVIGKDPAQLDEMIFAAHPVTVRVGDEYHVRSIQRVTPEGDLVFFSAIDTGMVLTVSEAQDMADHLDNELGRMVEGRGAPTILGCDCLLRRIEAVKSQAQMRLNRVFQTYGVVGFSTYGEQIGPLHVNHTMTGVALFPPPKADPD